MITTLLNPDFDLVLIFAGKPQPNLENTIAWEARVVAVNGEWVTPTDISVLFVAVITIPKLQLSHRARGEVSDTNGHGTISIFSHDRDISAITALDGQVLG